MKTQRQHFLGMVLLAIMSFMSLPSLAEYYVSEVTLSPGQQTKIYLPDMYVEAMTRYGGGYPYTWSSDNSSVCTATTYRSRTYCNIYAKSVGTTKIHYHGEYYRNGVIYDYDCYWDVKVVSSGGEGENTGGDIPGDDINTPTDSWDKSGNYTISWYNKNTNEFSLSTAKEFAGLAYLVNNKYADFYGKTIKIANDIDLTGKRWMPIGEAYSDMVFRGTLDGQGHTISYTIAEEENHSRGYGLFAYTKNATIKNVYIQGDIKLQNLMQSDSYGVVHIGGLVSEADYCTFESCDCNVNISYKRTKEGSFGSAVPKYVRLGGIVGIMESCNARYCTHDGNITCVYGPQRQVSGLSEAVMVGGLFGDIRSSKIEYCENNTPLISDERQGTSYDSYHTATQRAYYLGGVAGTSDYASNIFCCRTLCNFSATYYGNSNSDEPQYHMASISNGSGTITNCYAVVSTVKVSSGKNSTTYGYGIGGGSKSKANYRNSDVAFDTNVTITKGEEGTAFTSAQMQTSAFLEELNLYSMLEMDGIVWAQDDGGYPYAIKLREATGMTPIYVEKESGSFVFTLSGQRLAAPYKGINIIGGKKVIVK